MTEIMIPFSRSSQGSIDKKTTYMCCHHSRSFLFLRFSFFPFISHFSFFDPQNIRLLGAERRASTLVGGSAWSVISRQLAAFFGKSTGAKAYTLVLRIPSRSCRRQPQTHGQSALCGHQKRNHGLGTSWSSAKTSAAVSDGVLDYNGRALQGPGSEIVLESVGLVVVVSSLGDSQV